MSNNTERKGKETADLQLVTDTVRLEEVVSNSCDAAMTTGREQECGQQPDIPAVNQEADRYTQLGEVWTWREKLWVVPGETRIGTTELAEVLGRPKSWIYARTQVEAENQIPHRKLDGFLYFVVGEIRTWIEEREVVFPAAGWKEVV